MEHFTPFPTFSHGSSGALARTRGSMQRESGGWGLPETREEAAGTSSISSEPLRTLSDVGCHHSNLLAPAGPLPGTAHACARTLLLCAHSQVRLTLEILGSRNELAGLSPYFLIGCGRGSLGTRLLANVTGSRSGQHLLLGPGTPEVSRQADTSRLPLAPHLALEAGRTSFPR